MNQQMLSSREELSPMKFSSLVPYKTPHGTTLRIKHVIFKSGKLVVSLALPAAEDDCTFFCDFSF
jgi:hypothetical protein